MAYSHQWYLKNKESLNKARKAYNQRNRAKVTAAQEIINQIRLYGAKREDILSKFNYKCACCGISGKLDIHHIDGNGVSKPVSKKNNTPENLIVVCKSCHMKMDWARRTAENVCVACGKTGMRYAGKQMCQKCYQASRAEYKKQWFLNRGKSRVS